MRKIALKIASEEQEHLALMEWVNLNPFIREHLIHVPNGGSRHVLEAKKLKKMGVKAGVSDFFLAIPVYGFHGLWLELKNAKGKLSDPQRYWLNLMIKQGYAAGLAFGWIDAKGIILQYLTGTEENIRLNLCGLEL